MTKTWTSGIERMIVGEVASSDHANIHLDNSTHALTTISYAHHEAHSGSSYQYSTHDADFDTSDTIRILVTTPDTTSWAHMEWEVIGALTTLVQLFEDTTHAATTDGALTVYNKNRNSTNSAGVVLNTAAPTTDTADGTQIDVASFGISTGQGIATVSGGGQGRGTIEWILAQDTVYMLMVTSGVNDNNVTVKVNWYEHQNKTST